MSNLAGKSYALTVISPVRFSWLNRYIYAFLRCLPGVMGWLDHLQIIHFARWVLLPADRWPGEPAGRTRHSYVLFASNFNNTWDAYLDEFSDVLAVGLDVFWYGGLGFKKSVPSTPFKQYINHNSFDADYFYNAIPGHAVRDVNNALIVRQAIAHLETRLNQLEADASLSEADRDQQFEQLFNQVLRSVQNRLPTAGQAPVAGSSLKRLKRQRMAMAPISSAVNSPSGCDAEF